MADAAATPQAGDARARRQVAASSCSTMRTSTTRSPVRCSAISIPPARCARTARACSCTRACKRGVPRAAARARQRHAHRRPARSGDPGRRAHLRGAHGQGARATSRAAAPRARACWPAAARVTTGDLADGLLRGADRVRRLPRRHGHRARGDLRPGDVGARVRGRGGGRSRAPTPPSSVSPPGCSPTT